MTHPKVLAPASTRRDLRRPTSPGSPRRQRSAFVLACSVLTLLFVVPLVSLVRFALDSALYSHIPLIPFVSGYIAWVRRPSLPAVSGPATFVAVGATLVSASLIGLYWAVGASESLSTETSLAFTTAAFLAGFLAIAAWCLGQARLKALAFPLGFLVFMIPLPSSWIAVVETLLQHGSAAVAHVLFRVSGTVVFYQNLTFQLPGINLRVAPECSGIHSTLALLMVSLVAGHFFLRSTSRAAALTALILPLALLRNGFRIFVVGELCVTRGPHMIESPLHRQGGPIFFALSLLPFIAALWLLARSERRLAGPH